MVFVVVSVFLSGCAANEVVEQSNADLTLRSWTSALSRTLPSPVPVSDVEDVGLPFDQVVARETSSYVAGPAVSTTDTCRTVRYAALNGIAALRRTCPELSGLHRDSLNFYPVGRILPVRTFTDRNGDGKVDAISDEGAARRRAEDSNFDGRVDVLVETIASVGGAVDLTLFGAGWSLDRGAAYGDRKREDVDFDGSFDTETIYASDPTDDRQVGFIRVEQQ